MLLAHPLTSEIRVIDLHPVGEPTVCLASKHRLHPPVLHKPRRFVAHAELAHELQPSHGVVALRHQIDAQEPLRQAQFGVLEDGADNGAALIAAAHTLPQSVPVVGEGKSLAATARANNPIAPTSGHEARLALLVGAVLLQEFSQR